MVVVAAVVVAVVVAMVMMVVATILVTISSTGDPSSRQRNSFRHPSAHDNIGRSMVIRRWLHLITGISSDPPNYPPPLAMNGFLTQMQNPLMLGHNDYGPNK